MDAPVGGTYISNSICDIELLVKFRNKNGRWPASGGDAKEKKLYGKLVRLRRAYRGGSDAIFHQEYLNVAEQLGYPNMFRPSSHPDNKRSKDDIRVSKKRSKEVKP